MGKTFFKWVENTVGKGEIARYEQFLVFPQCFQKTCTTDTQKPELVWERVNTQSNKEKKRKCWLHAFTPFPTMLSIISKTYFFTQPSAKCFNSFPSDKI